MKHRQFIQLTRRQQQVMIMAIYLQTALADFRAEHLSDAQIEELGAILRQGLSDVITMIEDADQLEQLARLENLLEQIPDEWEVPHAA